MNDLKIDSDNVSKIYQSDVDSEIYDNYQGGVGEVPLEVEESQSSSDTDDLVNDPLAVSTEYRGADTNESPENKANDLANEAEECVEEAREAANEAANSLAQENDGEAAEMAEIADIAAKAANEVLAQAEGLAAENPDSESIQEAVGEIRNCAAQADEYADMARKTTSAEN
jgi:acyl-CoA reductase-like NAD-dependent aldehyde dehydrogenase